MYIEYKDGCICISVSRLTGTECIDRVYLEKFKDAKLKLVYDTFKKLIGIDIIAYHENSTNSTQ